MAERKKPTAKTAKTDRVIIGSAGFDKIGAVEGIELTPTMKRRASEARAKGLTAEELRRAIISSHRKG